VSPPDGQAEIATPWNPSRLARWSSATDVSISGGLPPPSTAGVGPYGDLTNPDYYGKNPYAEGFNPTPPRAYTFE
jgi:hypothetical protein